jgi:hypothetical protein
VFLDPLEKYRLAPDCAVRYFMPGSGRLLAQNRPFLMVSLVYQVFGIFYTLKIDIAVLIFDSVVKR